MEAKHLIMIASVLIAIALVLIFFVWNVRRQQKKYLQAKDFLALQALRSMLMHLQRHRTLSVAVLDGDQSMLAELALVQSNTSRDLQCIALEADWAKKDVPADWLAITAHWARLAGRYQYLNIRQNLDQHTKLIKNLLAFIDEIITTLNLRTPRVGYPLQGQTSWRYLLDLTEGLGQLRAIGLAYIASMERGEQAPRLRNALQTKVTELTQALELNDCNQSVSKSQKNSILQFIECFPEALLKNPKKCSIKHYHQSATAIMDALYMEFDKEIKKLQDRL
ncbi:nitrate- and nitrite sensing domain-containing protein [Marinagarivorans algicola]|uniref:nitrate- and nitrite sensing domain-containing protein n=1 Tax=Marinagarivorans algicola TaxID=1513270 RepID=UPI0006B63FC1|nr:nitrate- and nitrite sensing domain-containing protein [Marinagarivorans algicola]